MPRTKPRDFRLRNFQRPQNARSGRWYEIKNVSDSTTEVAIYDEIGYWGVSAADFVTDLNTIKTKTITLRINSPGGDVQDGLAMLNALRQHPATVNVIVEGWAISAASFIAMAGDHIAMAPNSMLMIHDASASAYGNASDLRDLADLLDKHSDNIARVYQRRAGGSVEDWRTVMQAETWYSDQEAVDAGLADEILGAEPADDAPQNVAQTTVKAVVASEPTVFEETDSVVTPPAQPEPVTEASEAFDFDAFRAAMTAVKEATRG